MSAQKSTQSSTSQTTSREESASSRGQQSSQQGTLARRSALPDVPSLLLDPLGFFADDDPFTLLRRMQREITRAFGQSSRQSGTGRQSGDVLSTTVWVPPIEVAYRDGNLVVSAELPGINDEDVSVSITDDAIIIQGERQEQRDESDGGVRRTELRYGQFFRAIPLPDGAQPDQARAEFKNGVLQITLPISQAQSNVRQIPVQTGASAQGASSQQSASSQAGQTQAQQQQQQQQQSGKSETPAGEKAA